MFIRKTRKKDKTTGKEYFLFQLVESYRTDRGPRQRILLNLGSDLDLSDEERKWLANRIEELFTGNQQILFPYPPKIEELAERYVSQLIRKASVPEQCEKSQPTENFQSVDISTLEHEQSRTVGMEHIVHQTLVKLEVGKKLLELGMTDRQVEVAIGVIVAKLIQSGSELATHKWLQTQSGIDELIGTDFTKLGLRSVYQAGDNLLRHKEELECHLRNREKSLFSLEDTVVLYDLTNTYFEGAAGGVEKASRGHSKEKRSDCPLVTLGLVLDRHGFPLRSEVLPGNVSEAKTLETALSRLLHHPHQKPTIVFDAGIASEENLLYLRQNGYSYIVASKRRSVDMPAGLQLDLVKEMDDNRVRAAQVKDEETQEIVLYCHSTQRQKKEEGMRTLLQKRLEKDLQQVSDALNKKGGTKSYPKVLERIGRLKEKHRRVASYYDIKVCPDESGVKAISIVWESKESKLEQRFQGAYCLRSFGLDWSSSDLWHTYVMLTQVEEAFRCLKTDLGLRPVYHRIEKRVDAHLFITILAYHVMQTVLHQLKLSGMPMHWITLCRHMASQVRVTSSMQLEDGRQLRVRTSTRPEFHQREIYSALNLPIVAGSRVITSS